MPVSAKGVESVLSAFGKARKATGQRIDEALVKCAHILLQTSQPFVPVATGALKRSGRVEKKGTGLNAEARVIYELRYAIFVHENLQATHAPPTKARFLADAVPIARGTMTALLKRSLKAATRDLV